MIHLLLLPNIFFLCFCTTDRHSNGFMISLYTPMMPSVRLLNRAIVVSVVASNIGSCKASPSGENLNHSFLRDTLAIKREPHRNK